MRSLASILAIGAALLVSLTADATQQRQRPADRRVENVVQGVRRSYERRPPEWRRRAAVCLHYLDEAEAFHRQGEAYFVEASRARSQPEQSRLVRLGNDAIKERQRLISEFWACTRRTTEGDEFASQDRPPPRDIPPPPPVELEVEDPPERPGSWLPPGFPFPPAEARPQPQPRRRPSPSSRTTPGRSTASVIVALGDSLTAAGKRLQGTEAWPGVMEERLNAQAPASHVTVKNAGVDNDTSAMALSRLDRELSPDTKVVIVAIGMNDFKGRVPIAGIRANIGAIIQRAQARGIKVVLCAFEEDLHGPPYDDQFKALYPQLQAQYRVPMVRNLMSVVWSDPARYTTDGIHPNALGARQMAYKILPVLRPLLGMGSPARPEPAARSQTCKNRQTSRNIAQIRIECRHSRRPRCESAAM